MIKQTAGLLLICGVALAGCAARPVEVNTPNADSRTGEMVVFLRNPIVLQRSVPGLSAHGRDFVYLAPVSTNRQGVDSVYLWVGIASTIDRAVTRSRPLNASYLRFRLGQEELTIPLLEWHESRPPAPPSAVPIARSLRSVLTLADYERVVAAEPESILLLEGDQRIGEFQIWSGGWTAWHDLAGDTEVGLGVEVKVATRRR